MENPALTKESLNTTIDQMSDTQAALSEFGQAATLTGQELEEIAAAMNGKQFKSKYVENRSERRKREQADKAEARRTRRGMNRIERILGGREA